jgi:AcrR family transcriptional regulator
MVAICSEIGYRRTRVSDLISTAGVSRATFYSYFPNKERCFLETLDELIAAGLRATSKPGPEGAPLEERARRGARTFAELLVRQPAAARLCLVESYAAGPAALERVDGAMKGFERLLAYLFERLPGEGEMPPMLVSALVGGIRKMIHSRLHRHTERELIDLLPAVLDLDLTYRPPCRPLRYGGARKRPAAPRGPAAAEPRDKIERATLAVVAEDGFGEAAIADIASRAGVSLTTFYAQFDGKEEALERALESSRTRLWATSEPVFRRASSWPEAIRDGIESAFGFYEAEPDYARVATTDVYAAGATELERLEISIERLSAFVEGGYDLDKAIPPIAREAIPSAMYSMLCQRVTEEGTDGLRELTPCATYLVLAPFIGPREATAMANRPSRAGRPAPVASPDG